MRNDHAYLHRGFVFVGVVLLVIAQNAGCRKAHYAHFNHPDADMLVIDLGNDLRFFRLSGTDVWFGTCEVENSQFRTFRPEHDSGQYMGHNLNDDELPVVNVSFHDAHAYCRWLSKRYKALLPKGFQVRVPRVAEWELAAQCGTNEDYPLGRNLPPTSGNYADQAFLKAFPQVPASHVYLPSSPLVRQYDDGFPVAIASQGVCTNTWGFRGLGGNVREWTSDIQAVDYGQRATAIIKDLSWATGGFADQYMIRSKFIAPQNARSFDLGIRLVISSRQE